MTRDNDRHDGGEYVGNMEAGALQSVLEAFPRDSENCLNCGIRLPERKRRRGSARRCCSARCRKEAWLGRTQSVSGQDSRRFQLWQESIVDAMMAGIKSGKSGVDDDLLEITSDFLFGPGKYRRARPNNLTKKNNGSGGQV